MQGATWCFINMPYSINIVLFSLLPEHIFWGGTQLREVWEEEMVVHVDVQIGLPVHPAENAESLLNVSLVGLFLHTLNLDSAKIKPSAWQLFKGWWKEKMGEGTSF